MPVKLQQLIKCADQLLQPHVFNDYSPNGLQVQGRDQVQCLVSGVTASQALLDRAVELGADAILVHHGYFWKGESPCITGMKYHRLKTLLSNDISLIAYHLPLDAHPQYGNNAQLATLLGITVSSGMEPDNPYSVGNVGYLDSAISADEFNRRVSHCLGRESLLINGGSHPIKTLAWCSGGAQGYIDKAAALGVDAYLSGEISEPTVHSARELGIHYIAAGHHATERYGVQAVAQYLAQQLSLDHHFVDIDSPA